MTSPTSDAPRRRWGRILLILVLGLCGLFVAVLAILPSILRLERVKSQITAQAEAQLKRDVEVGQVRLQILTGLGAGLEQLTIANPPGWQSPHFVRVDTLSVKLALWPLLQRRIEVRKIILSDGEIVVERDEKGRMNYDDLTASPPTEGTTPEPSPPAPPTRDNPLNRLLVSQVALRQVDLTFIDRMSVPGQAQTTRVQNVQANMANIGLNTPIDFDFAASLLAENKPNIHLHGQFGPIPATLDFDQVPLDVVLQMEALPLAPLRPYIGPEPALTAGQLNLDLQVRGTLGSTLDMDGVVSLKQAVLADTTGKNKPIPLPDVTLTQDATVDMAQATVELTEVRLDMAPIQATVKGMIEQFKTAPRFDLRLATNAFALGDVFSRLPMLAQALRDDTKAQGRLQLQATATGTTDHVRSTATIEFHELDVRMADGTRLALPQGQLRHETSVNMPQSTLQVAQAQLDLGALKASLSGTVQQFSTTPRLALQWQTNRFAVADVLALAHLPMLASALPKPTQWQGHLTLQGSAEGVLESLKTNLRVASDTLSVQSGTFSGAASGDGLRLDLADVHATLQARLHPKQPPDANLDVKMARFVFDQHTAAAAPAAPSSPPPGKPGTRTAKDTVPVASDPPAAPPVNLQGKVAIAAGQIKAAPFQDLLVDLLLLKGLLKTKQSVKTFEGTVQGQFQANLAQAKPDFTLHTTVSSINAGQVVNTFTSAPNILFGALDTTMQFSGKGFDWAAISSGLTGNGKLQLTDFELTTLDLMPKLAQTLSVVGNLGGFTVPDDLATRSFDKVKGSVRVAHGKLHSDDLKLSGPDVELLGKAILGLDQSLHFDGTVVLLPKLAKALGKPAAFLQNPKGTVELPLAIRGTVTRPQIAMHENHLIELAKKSLAQQAQDKGIQALEKLLDKQLPQSQSGKAPGPGKDAKETNPINELNKALQGLIKR